MSNRNLELTLRARADTSGLTKLSDAVDRLEASMTRLVTALDRVVSSGRGVAMVGGQIANQEARAIEGATGLADAITRGADARQRAVVQTKNSIIAEERAVLAAEKQAQAVIKTAAANEQLIQSQSKTQISSVNVAIAEQKLSQEREKTALLSKRVEKEEANIAKARDQARVAAVRAEEAEGRLAKGRSAFGDVGSVLAKGLGAAGIALSAEAIGRKLIQLGKDSLDAASRAEEGAAKFRAVYKTMSNEVMRELEVMASANRRSAYDLVDYSSQLQAVFGAMGIGAEQAREMSTAVTQLGVDFGAFFNIADSHAVDNLTSALIGNHRAVKQFGIPLNVAAINMELMRMGMNGLRGEALEAAKVMARFNIIMRNSADIQGAAIREAGTYANVMKAFGAAVLDLKVSIGEGLKPPMIEVVNLATELVKTLSGANMENVAKGFEDSFARAGDVEGQVARLRIVRNTIIENGNFMERFDAKLGGVIPGTEAIVSSIAQSSASAEEFAMWMEKAGINVLDLPNKLTGIDRLFVSPEKLAAAYFEYEQAVKRAAVAAQEAADADRGLRILAGLPDIEVKEVKVDVEVDEEEKLEGFKAEIREQARELRQVWIDAFNADSAIELFDAQQAFNEGQMSNLFAGDAQAAEEAQTRIEQANAAIVESFKQRAFDILATKAVESGDFALLGSIQQAAVAMGLITQEEANVRTAYANTMQQIELLSGSTVAYGLTATEVGNAVRLVAEGIVTDWEKAVEAAKQMTFDGMREDYEGWKSQIGADSAPEWKSTVATEFGTSISDFTDLKSVMEEFDQAEYEAEVRAAYGNTKTDIDEIRDKLINLTKDPWLIRIEQQTRSSGGASGGGGGGGGSNPDPEEDGRGRTFVVEGVTVNNYSGGPGVAEQTRRGVLAAFRSLA